MKGGIAERLKCPERGSHPRLGRKQLIENDKVMRMETVFRDKIKKECNRIEYKDNWSQTEITCFKNNKVDNKERYINYKLYFSDSKLVNKEPNFMKETENIKYRKYLNDTEMVENIDDGGGTDEMKKFWNPEIYPFTKTRKY